MNSLLVTTMTLGTAGLVVLAVLIALSVVARGLFHPRSQLWGKVIWHGRPSHAPSSDGRHIALTFDDGPHPQATPQVLDILDQYDIKATFFVIGKFAEAHPEIIRQIHARGHLIGNHTWDHHHLGTLRGKRYWEKQMTATSDLILDITGQRPQFFRPPMGFRTRHTMAAARDAGLVVVNWTRRGRDGVASDAQAIAARFIGRCQSGDILTLHDGVDPRVKRDWQPTVAALPAILDHLREQNFELVRLDKLLDERP